MRRGSLSWSRKGWKKQIRGDNCDPLLGHPHEVRLEFDPQALPAGLNGNGGYGAGTEERVEHIPTRRRPGENTGLDESPGKHCEVRVLVRFRF